MRNNVWKIIMLTGILASASCKEKSFDYEYRIVNDQPCDVILKFTLDKNNVSYEDTIAPSTDTLIYLREDVTGNEVWDVETAAQVYPFKEIAAYRMTEPIDTSKNLKLRRMWEGVIETSKYGEDRGVYTLHLVDSVFNKTILAPTDSISSDSTTTE
ncbi:MAG: hypothetical protein U0K66_00210 [Paludibacteraceae bacterium]|jgi:hypothetical protein|nr:hypothetical protein [Paludibacteraceae bacterium]